MKHDSASPTVTVIMPVYNAERTLSRAIDSVIDQTFRDWHLIVLDDCSTDSSHDIALKFTDPRISVVRTESNGGPAKARNLGMDRASGKYLAFIDSDDAYHPSFLEAMVTEAEKYDAEMVWCNYSEAQEADVTAPRPVCIRFPGNNPRGRNEAVMAVFRYNNVFGSMWCKVYRREFIERHGLRIDEKRVRGEDWEFNIRVFDHLERWAFVNRCLYTYYIHGASVMRTYRASDLYQLGHSLSIVSGLASRNGIELTAEYMTRYHLTNILEYCVALARNERGSTPRLIRRLMSGVEIRRLFDKTVYDSLPRAYRPLAFMLKYNLIVPASLYAWILSRIK